MQKVDNYLVNKIFTIPNMDKIVGEEDTNLLAECVSSGFYNKANTYGDVIVNLYHYMDIAYRNEYYFKNTIFNQLLLKHHSLGDTVALTELPIAESKADFVMINGRGIVYEIKTDLDNLLRLENQIADYYKAFTYVNVVVGYKQFDKVKELLMDTLVGIFVLYDNGNLVCKKRAKYYDKELSYDVMFEVLRKYEFEKIILKYNKKLPQVNSFLYYRECLKYIKKLGKRTIHKEMLECLKERNLSEKKYDVADKVPYELKFFAYFSNKSSSNTISKFWNKRMEV